MSMRRIATLGLAPLLLVGCEEDEGEQIPDPCADTERFDEYAPGLEKEGAQVRVSLERATPAPPEKGDNLWEVEITDLDGAPIEGLDVSVFPFMPEHGHGTPVDPEVSPGEDPGEYAIDRINFVMGGPWEITFSLESAEAQISDEVVFSFCVPD